MSHAQELAGRVCLHERKAIAEALNLIDDQRAERRAEADEMLRSLPGERLASGGHLVGITGPPGAGKSTLISRLIAAWRRAERRVGVLAVDPSSHVSGGALLGDRLRMLQPEADDGVFIRSLANRRQLGGLSAETWPMSQVFLAAFDVVVIETVGVGQSEVDVAELTDTTVHVMPPGAGDSIQFLKAGVMEVPDIIAANKSDMGDSARRTAHSLRSVLPGQGAEHSWATAVCLVSAQTGDGIPELVERIDDHRSHLLKVAALAPGRAEHGYCWALQQLKTEFGANGLSRLGGEEQLRRNWPVGGSSLAHYQELREGLLG